MIIAQWCNGGCWVPEWVVINGMHRPSIMVHRPSFMVALLVHSGHSLLEMTFNQEDLFSAIPKLATRLLLKLLMNFTSLHSSTKFWQSFLGFVRENFSLHQTNYSSVHSRIDSWIHKEAPKNPTSSNCTS